MTDDAAKLLADAEEQIEAWWCELDATWARLLADADARAAVIIDEAEADAAATLAAAADHLADAEAEATRVRAVAAESDATARTLARAADAAVKGRVHADDLAALGHAVQRLRIELSRVVDAAFDALPAVEATAAVLGLDDAPLPEPTPEPPRRRHFLRRLLGIG